MEPREERFHARELSQTGPQDEERIHACLLRQINFFETGLIEKEQHLPCLPFGPCLIK